MKYLVIITGFSFFGVVVVVVVDMSFPDQRPAQHRLCAQVPVRQSTQSTGEQDVNNRLNKQENKMSVIDSINRRTRCQ